MRTWITALALLIPTAALAQDGKPAPTSKPAKPKFDWTTTLRISADAEATLDGKKQKPNAFQYYLWERLNHFRLRVDAVKPIGQPKMDKYIARVTRWWEKNSPSKNHPAKLKLIASQQTKYDASKFYGEAQAHNFKGTIKAQLQSVDGDVIATWSVEHSWGKLIRSGMSKSQVNGLFNQMVHKALAMKILSHDAIKTKLSAKNKAKLNTWLKAEKAKLMKILDGSTKAVKTGPFYKFVKTIPVEADKKDDAKGSK